MADRQEEKLEQVRHLAEENPSSQNKEEYKRGVHKENGELSTGTVSEIGGKGKEDPISSASGENREDCSADNGDLPLGEENEHGPSSEETEQIEKVGSASTRVDAEKAEQLTENEDTPKGSAGLLERVGENVLSLVGLGGQTPEGTLKSEHAADNVPREKELGDSSEQEDANIETATVPHESPEAEEAKKVDMASSVAHEEEAAASPAPPETPGEGEDPSKPRSLLGIPLNPVSQGAHSLEETRPEEAADVKDDASVNDDVLEGHRGRQGETSPEQTSSGLSGEEHTGPGGETDPGEVSTEGETVGGIPAGDEPKEAKEMAEKEQSSKEGPGLLERVGGGVLSLVGLGDEPHPGQEEKEEPKSVEGVVDSSEETVDDEEGRQELVAKVQEKEPDDSVESVGETNEGTASVPVETVEGEQGKYVPTAAEEEIPGSEGPATAEVAKSAEEPRESSTSAPEEPVVEELSRPPIDTAQEPAGKVVPSQDRSHVPEESPVEEREPESVDLTPADQDRLAVSKDSAETPTNLESQPSLSVYVGKQMEADRTRSDETPPSTPRGSADELTTTPRGTPLIQRVEQIEEKLAQLEGRPHSPISSEIGTGPSTPRSSLDKMSRHSARYVLLETGLKGTLLDRVAALEQKLSFVTLSGIPLPSADDSTAPIAGESTAPIAGESTAPTPSTVVEEPTAGPQVQPLQVEEPSTTTKAGESLKETDVEKVSKLSSEEASKAAEDTAKLNITEKAPPEDETKPPEAPVEGRREKKSKSKAAAGKLAEFFRGCFHHTSSGKA